MTPTQANTAIRNALETWEQLWPQRNELSPGERYFARRLDAGLRYVAELCDEGIS